jgi:hypothetical protein
LRRILIDLSHNEAYQRIPQNVFDIDYIFDFTQRGGSFPQYQELKKYDVVLIGEILPADNQHDHLFREEEIHSIRRYVKEGGRLLLTSSSGGDFNYEGSRGSIRSISAISAVKRFYWGELFNHEGPKYYDTQENLILTEFPNHPLFKNVNKLIFADSTFLEPTNHEGSEVLLRSPENTKFRSFENDKVRLVGKVPLVITNSFENGKSVTISNTFFMTPDAKYGIVLADNKVFFQNIIEWLLSDS